MSKDIKFISAAFLVSIVVIVGVAFVFSKKSSGDTEIPTTEVLGLTASPQSYDLGSVPISGGIVSRDYEIKNTTSGKLTLKKIATSCMCTTARVKIGDKETRFFGMEMTGDKNAPVSLEIPAGESAKVTVNFDPAAHGPAGTGPFDRIVWLSFAQGMKELKFNGTVVAQ